MHFVAILKNVAYARFFLGYASIITTLHGGSSKFITILHGGGEVFPIHYNITWEGGSLGNPNLYYRIYGRSLRTKCLHNIGAQKIADVLGRIINSNPKNPSLIILCNTA